MSDTECANSVPIHPQRADCRVRRARYREPTMARVARSVAPRRLLPRLRPRQSPATTRLCRRRRPRDSFLALFVLCEQRHGWTCHALHAALDALPRSSSRRRAPNLSAGLKQLNGRYARRFNRRHGRFGHVFAERYSSQRHRDRGLPLRRLRVRPAEPRRGRPVRRARRVAVVVQPLPPPSPRPSVPSRGRSRAPCGSRS